MRFLLVLNGSVLVSSIRSLNCSTDFKGPLTEIADFFDDPSLPSISSLVSASSPLSSSYSDLLSSCSSEIPLSLLCEEFISLLPDLSFSPTPLPVFPLLFLLSIPVHHSSLRPPLPPRLPRPARFRPPFYSNSIPEFHRTFLPLRNLHALPRGLLHRLRRNPHSHRHLRFHVSTFPRLGPRDPRRRPVFPRFHRPAGALPRFIRRFLAGIRFQIPRDSGFTGFGGLFPRVQRVGPGFADPRGEKRAFPRVAARFGASHGAAGGFPRGSAGVRAHEKRGNVDRVAVVVRRDGERGAAPRGSVSGARGDLAAGVRSGRNRGGRAGSAVRRMPR